jgi:hypothetical protein
MKRKTVRYSFIIVVVVIIGVMFFAYREYNRKQKDVADISAAYTLTSEEIILAFSSDEKASNAKYLDKVLAVQGTVKSIDKDDHGFRTVVLGDTTSMSSVRCSMDSSHNEEAAKLQAGNRVIVKGICTGFNADELLGSDVILNRGTIKNN